MKEKIQNLINGKRILITGGTGSFGNAVTDCLLKLNPREVVIFSRDEKKQFDMGNKYGSGKVRFIIGDVRDRKKVDRAMKEINLVFHAAALKQVPSCEFFPMEAIRTNAIGAHNIVNSAVDNDVERVVVLSTDKAVYPINVMGMTKALMERIMTSVAEERRSKTILCGTRYGNVMYTRGSIIPLFVNLIKEGKPLRVTNRDMTRFMMHLGSSIDLALYALANGENGAIYVRKAPAATIGTLAEAIASLFSYNKGIEEIGIRPGEKMHETLISREELLRTEDCGDYYKINPEFLEKDYRLYFLKGRKNVPLPFEGYTSENTKRLSLEEMKDMLLSVEEFQEELQSYRNHHLK